MGGGGESHRYLVHEENLGGAHHNLACGNTLLLAATDAPN